MSSPYEDELKRLIRTRKSEIRRLKQENASVKRISEFQAEISLLEADLKSFQKALARYREKPAEPAPSQPTPAS